MNDLFKGFVVVLGIVGGLALLVLFMLYVVWAAAFVGVHLWIWFIVPVFHVAPLTLSQSFGISLLVSFWTYHFHRGTKDDRESKEKALELAGLFLFPWSTLLVGYICHHFFMGA